jgi:hypothetical protein
MKIPGPDHPITIDANPSRVVVKVGGKIIADTSDALTLREVSYPPVQYQAVHTGRSDRRDLAPWLCVLICASREAFDAFTRNTCNDDAANHQDPSRC